MAIRRYLTIFVVAMICLFSLIVFVVSLVDPYGVVGLVNIKGFNDAKPAQVLATRIYRPFDYLKGNYDAVVVGGSREERGIDWADPAFQANHLRAYNFTFFESRPYEMAQVVDWLTARGSIKLIIVSFDLLRYNVEPTSVDDFRVFYPKSDFVWWAFSQYAKYSTSLQGLEESYQTIIASRAGQSLPVYLPNGRMLLHGDNPDASYDYERVFREDFDVYLNAFMPKIYPQAQRWLENGFDNTHVRRMLELAGARKFNFFAIIPPDHALQMETMRRKGLWLAFEKWKWELSCEFANARAKYPNATVEVWDFSGYGPVSRTPLPLRSKGQTGVMDYWDPVHFAMRTGSRILDAMLTSREQSKEALAFATALTPHNVREHLARIRRDREDYVANNSSAVAWLANIDRTPVPTIRPEETLHDLNSFLPSSCRAQ